MITFHVTIPCTHRCHALLVCCSLANSVRNDRVVHLLLSCLLWWQVLTHIGVTLLERVIRSELQGLLLVIATFDGSGFIALVVLLERVSLLRGKVDP